MEQNTMTKQNPVAIKNTLVKDHKAHYSYNLTNKASAQQLYNTLNKLYTQNTTTNNFEIIQQKLEDIELTLNEIKEALK